MTATQAQYAAARKVLAELDRLTDDDGLLQDGEALLLMPPERPEWHETQTYETAASRLGLARDEEGVWYEERTARAPETAVMTTQTVTITYGNDTATMTVDLSQATATIEINGAPSQYRTADARHSMDRAALLVARECWGADVESDEIEIEVE